MIDRAWRPALTMLGLSLAAGVRVLWAASAIAGQARERARGDAGGVLPGAGHGHLRYLRLLVFPWGFTVDPAIAPARGGCVGGWLALAALAFWRGENATRVVVRGRPGPHRSEQQRLSGGGPRGGPARVPAAAGFCALAGLLCRGFAGLDGLTGGALALLSAADEVWSSGRALWEEAARMAPGKVRPLIQLARASDARTALAILDRAGTMRQQPSDRIGKGRGISNWEGRPRAGGIAGHWRSRQGAQALNNRGAALLALGQRDAAVGDFRRALAADRASGTRARI